jgi:hypothetical protein
MEQSKLNKLKAEYEEREKKLEDSKTTFNKILNEENKKLANSNSSPYTLAISGAWGQAVSAIRDEL